GDDEFFRAVTERLADPAHATRVVDVRMDYDGRRASWVMHDQGSGFDAPAVMRKLDEDAPDVTRASGRGLLMIRAFTDEMRYDDRGRRLTMVIYRHPEQERRQQERWPACVPVQVTPLDAAGGDPCDAVGRNLSSGGLAFVAAGGAPPQGR